MSATTTALAPMAARIGHEIPGHGWTFEPKYDGVRVLAFATPRGARLVTRNGRNKATQFPEVARAVKMLAARLGRSLVLDGEIVALDHGAPARFQALQKRVHLEDARAIERDTELHPAALVVFDLLRDGRTSLVDLPWTERRTRLEAVMAEATSPSVRLGETARGAGARMMRRAHRAGWEGIMAKRMDARYQPGERSDDWLKLKIEHRQELVVGGWTEPRNTRPYIGALLLGYYDGTGRLVYAGHAGGGFTREGLKAMHDRLTRLERRTSPFAAPPRTNEPAHWVQPKVVVEVRFNEWTADGRLRQPIVVGVRDDKDPRDVHREAESVQR